MKKVFLVLFSFLVGTSIAIIILINPFQWNWVEPAQHHILSILQPNHNPADFDEGQLWTCGMHPHVIQEEPGNCPVCKMDLIPLKDSTAGKTQTAKPEVERQIKHWVAPMDPTYLSDKPGKSPMGMDLVPVYEEQSTEGFVQIDPAFVQNIGVQSTEVERNDIPFQIRTIGNVTYNEKQMFLINTKYSGWIENVELNYIGEPVHEGQKLFEIYSPELLATQKEYLDALKYAKRMSQNNYPDVLRRANALTEASRERLRFWDITDEQISQLERSRKPMRTLAVYSPAEGIVLEKMNSALEGMYVKPGMNLYKIVDLTSVWVDAEVFEDQLPWMKLGGKAQLEFPHRPGKHFIGFVRYLYPYLNPKTRTVKVSLEVLNTDRSLKADMYANIFFNVPSITNVLTVPEEAVIHSGKRNVVVLDRGEGSFQVKEVELGVNGEGIWEVKKGIELGDRVVISSQFLIDSESNLREAIRKMISSKANHSGH